MVALLYVCVMYTNQEISLDHFEALSIDHEYAHPCSVWASRVLPEEALLQIDRFDGSRFLRHHRFKNEHSSWRWIEW